MSDSNLENFVSNNSTLNNIDEIYQIAEQKKDNYDDVKDKYTEILRDLIKKFLLKTEFNGLYTYNEDMDTSKGKYNGLNITCCKIQEDKIHAYFDAFSKKFLAVPLFWKDYICMFYIALKQFNDIKSDSRIISLGESPMKIVLIQEFFFKNENIKRALQANNYAYNVSFDYFSISRLQSEVKNAHKFEDSFKNNISEIYKIFPKRNYVEINSKIVELFVINNELDDYFVSTKVKNVRSLDRIHEHFIKGKLNPKYILTENKKIYIQDRCESYSSVLGLIFLYIRLCIKEEITLDERKELYKLLYIVGFDAKDNRTEIFMMDESKRYAINYIMYYLFSSAEPGKKDDTIIILNEKLNEYHFKQNNYFYEDVQQSPIGEEQQEQQTPEERYNAIFLKNVEKDLFFSQKNTLYKILAFLSIPEFNVSDSRCIQGINLYYSGEEEPDMTYKSINNIKQQGEVSLLCNFFNFLIIYYLNILASKNILVDIINNFKRGYIVEEEIYLNKTYNEIIFGGSQQATEWWKNEQQKMNSVYKAKNEIYKDKIIQNLEYEDDNNNYFKNLIKSVEIQRMIGTIRNYSFSELPYDTIYALKKSKESIPLTYSNDKPFVYNESYLKIFIEAPREAEQPPLPPIKRKFVTKGQLDREAKAEALALTQTALTSGGISKKKSKKYTKKKLLKRKLKKKQTKKL